MKLKCEDCCFYWPIEDGERPVCNYRQEEWFEPAPCERHEEPEYEYDEERW